MNQRLAITALILSGLRCTATAELNPVEQAALEKWKLPIPAPLTPEEALKAIRVEDGFRVEIAAAEPLVEAPVCMVFDERGRMWVVEMTGYMPDENGSGEDAAVGKIVILTDVDGDGRADERRVFLDKLALPRAISLTRGGVLFCEPPNVWWVENKNDAPGERLLVDGKYCGGGNPEHKTNGLLRGLDNAFYNAGGSRRLRWLAGKWLADDIGNRGQWGICQDDWGRLFYNNNSNQLLCDEAPAGWLHRNPRFRPDRGSSVTVCKDQSLFLDRPTPGINRAHMLDEKGRLKAFTGACGPCIYRGDQFPPEYRGNAFICEPCANMVRRLILTETDGRVAGAPGSREREFLSSADERFRPVNLSNAPDGTLCIVDMSRGIIQHRTYLTEFLRRQSLDRKLAQPLRAGRIWRVVSAKNSRLSALDLGAKSSGDLVAELSCANGWRRETAQRLLVDRGEKPAVAALEELAKNFSAPLGQLHALSTLEGLGELKPTIVLTAMQAKEPKVVAHAVRCAATFRGDAGVFAAVAGLAEHPSRDVRLSVALVAGSFTDAKASELCRSILLAKSNDALTQTAVMSGMGDRPLEMAAILKERPALAKLGGKGGLTKPTRKLSGEAAAQYERGAKLYEAYCFGCHQPDGGGFTGIAPPLVNSEWVSGDPVKFAKIIFSGLQGAVTVNKKLYQSPEIMPLMPGHLPVSELTDAAVADLMSYVRNTFGNAAAAVGAATVAEARKAAVEHPQPFDPAELGAQSAPIGKAP